LSKNVKKPDIGLNPSMLPFPEENYCAMFLIWLTYFVKMTWGDRRSRSRKMLRFIQWAILAFEFPVLPIFRVYGIGETD